MKIAQRIASNGKTLTLVGRENTEHFQRAVSVEIDGVHVALVAPGSDHRLLGVDPAPKQAPSHIAGVVHAGCGTNDMVVIGLTAEDVAAITAWFAPAFATMDATQKQNLITDAKARAYDNVMNEGHHDGFSPYR